MGGFGGAGGMMGGMGGMGGGMSMGGMGSGIPMGGGGSPTLGISQGVQPTFITPRGSMDWSSQPSFANPSMNQPAGNSTLMMLIQFLRSNPQITQQLLYSNSGMGMMNG